jgi:hypothetical protein
LRRQSAAQWLCASPTSSPRLGRFPPPGMRRSAVLWPTWRFFSPLCLLVPAVVQHVGLARVRLMAHPASRIRHAAHQCVL